MMIADGLLELRRRTTLVRGINPRGARHWGAASRRQTSHEGSWCQASIGASPPRSFSNSDQLLTDVGLWSCGRRTASSKRSGKSTGFLLVPTPPVARERVFRSRLPHYNDGIVPLRCDPWLEPIYRLRL